MDARDSLLSIARMVDTARTVLSDGPCSRLAVLLMVIDEPGICTQDIIFGTGMSQTAVSKHLSWLSKRGCARTTGVRAGGLGLIQAVEDPFDARVLRYYPTQTGKAFATMLAQASSATPLSLPSITDLN